MEFSSSLACNHCIGARARRPTPFRRLFLVVQRQPTMTTLFWIEDGQSSQLSVQTSIDIMKMTARRSLLELLFCVMLVSASRAFLTSSFPSFNKASSIKLWNSKFTDEDRKLHVELAQRTLEVGWISARKQSRPRFYTYDTCKAAVQAENLCSTKKEWEEFINTSEKRNCLIPSDPESVYSKQGTWVSWEDFLGTPN